MSAGTLIDRFEVMWLTLEVANDVVAFDQHRVLLELDRKRGEPRVAWDYETGPSYAGKQYERKVRQTLKLMQVFKTNKVARTSGWLRRGKRLYMVKMTYEGVVKGILTVSRDSPDEFSPTDVRLLKSVGVLSATAMCELQVFDLLKRLHLHFLDRRTAAYQAQDVKSVVEQYLEKIEYVFHPEVLDSPVTTPRSVVRVRSSAKLATENGTALYIVASRSTAASEGVCKDWSRKKLATRYEADGKSSITARVFARQLPYLTNEYQSLQIPTKRLFHDIKSHMSAPLVAGHDQCHGVLSVETTVKADYTPVHLHALALLAGHAARPLGRARDRELSMGRRTDLDVVRDMMGFLEGCNSWYEIQRVLCKGLQKLRYRRGLICEVLYDKKLVVGSHYWGPKMRDLCRKTRRHFIQNKNDCQIKAMMKKEPQVISNPRQDPAAHREAVKVAALGPFAIIPVLDSGGKVMWTLHVEREDTAPIGAPEIANLQQICRVAMATRERLEDSVHQQKITGIAIGWAQRLQKRFSRQTEVLENLAEFAVEHVCSRCRVYKFNGNYAVGVCHAGAKLTRVRKFVGFKFASNFPRVESVFRRNLGPVLVHRKINQAKSRPTTAFRTTRFGLTFHDKAVEKEKIQELVQVPLFIHGKFVNIVVFDKHGDGQNLGDGTFTESEVQLLGTLARLTSLALERTHLVQQVLWQASIGTSMGVFRHEIAGCVHRLSGTAALCRSESMPRESMIRELLGAIGRETGRMQHLREFFTDEVLKQKVRDPQYTTVAHEIDSAIELLGLTYSELIRKPNQNIIVRVPRLHRPLCLILLELLANAREATKGTELAWIKVSFKRGRGRQPHALSVSDSGEGVSEAIARKLRSKQLAVWGSHERGLGLWYAQLLAEGQGWTLRLARRTKPTRFEILLVTSF